MTFFNDIPSFRRLLVNVVGTAPRHPTIMGTDVYLHSGLICMYVCMYVLVVIGVGHIFWLLLMD